MKKPRKRCEDVRAKRVQVKDEEVVTPQRKKVRDEAEEVTKRNSQGTAHTISSSHQRRKAVQYDLQRAASTARLCGDE